MITNKKVKEVLDKSHFELNNLEQRIIYGSKSKNRNYPIIGPPGVGKSSLVKQIAKSLNKKFVKTALYGVYDESEISGHRLTYLGPISLRIINGNHKADVFSLDFLLDKIDKLNSTQGGGDPALVMLEILVPE